MRPLRIAYCIPALYYPSGMERVLTLKANYFAREFGYEVHIICTDGADRAPAYALDALIRVHHLHLDFDKMYAMPLAKRIGYYLVRQRRFRPLLEASLCEIRPDITISLLRRDINFLNKLHDGSLKMGELHFCRAFYRDFSNNFLPACIQRFIAKRWMNQLLRQLRRLSKFVVLSHEDAAMWRPDLHNVEVIHNPLSFVAEHPSDCTAKQVVAAGRYVPQKGFDRLIDAWRIVAERHPDWVLRIYGDGMRTELQAQIDRLGITDSCRLEHTTDQIAAKFRESSLFVLSSRFEGFGMVLIEAMACGLPVVSFTCPCGPRDIVADGEDGFLVPDGNIELLAEKICHLIESDELRKQMGRRAYEQVARFDIAQIAQQWKTLFETALRDKNR